MEISELQDKSKLIRTTTIQMAHDAPSSHIASALSCVDILVVLFFSVLESSDRFILSKGHAAMSYYAVLAEAGFFPKEWLKTYSQNGSKLPEHPPAHGVPGIEVATGSLGHGLSVALGAALARKIRGDTGREFVLLGDGECNEGSVWESALIASNLNLDNLTVIVDYNQMQAAGFMDKDSIVDKWRSFGWVVGEVDGNSVESLLRVFESSLVTNHSPSVIIANTTKGKGVSFMENDLLWHYRPPDDKELELALKELGNA